MDYLLDSGVLLRIFNRADPNRRSIRAYLSNLRANGHRLVASTQNLAEFWNVSTRPTEARGGYGLSIEETDRRARVIERLVTILPESPQAYRVWRTWVVSLSIRGVQVHDARLAAWMTAHGIKNIVTLNGADFQRYPRIIALSPISHTVATS